MGVRFRQAGRSRPGRERRKPRDRDVVLITNARRSRLEGWHSRRRTYIVLQLLRLPVLMLAGLVMWATHSMVASVAIAAVSVPLPWIAVVLANEPGEVEKKTQQFYKPALNRSYSPYPATGPALTQPSAPRRELPPAPEQATPRFAPDDPTIIDG